MAWKDVGPMEERIRFVLRATREEMAFTDLCVAFGVSRKTGYKWLGRYEAQGLDGMHERSRRPLNSPMHIENWIEDAVVRERRRHRTWGPKKLREKLAEKYDLDVVPAASTIGNIIKRHGLTKKKRRRRPVTQPDRTTRTKPTRPNEVWGADFKGWFRTKDGRRCDPLTSSDLYTRFVLICRSVDGQRIDSTKPEFRKAFMRYGLPEAIRVDNGSPFGSRGICGLTKLSAWWLQLGIRVEFIEPGHPEQNGVHERMHRTLKDETARPPAGSLKAQQSRFDRWRREFNYERPHEALGMQKPAQRYERSSRRYTTHPAPFGYPLDYEIRMVKTHGAIKWRNRFCYVGEALHGIALGLVEVADATHAVYFGDLLLGYLDEGTAESLRPPGGDFRSRVGHGV
jgi:putative transposase